MMTTKTVQIRSAVNNQKTEAELLLCPDCATERFFVYTPKGIDHVHFQCVTCGTSFCDGCTENESPAPPAADQPPKPEFDVGPMVEAWLANLARNGDPLADDFLAAFRAREEGVQ
jgi:hypothetical protein